MIDGAIVGSGTERSTGAEMLDFVSMGSDHGSVTVTDAVPGNSAMPESSATMENGAMMENGAVPGSGAAMESGGAEKCGTAMGSGATARNVSL